MMRLAAMVLFGNLLSSQLPAEYTKRIPESIQAVVYASGSTIRRDNDLGFKPGEFKLARAFEVSTPTLSKSQKGLTNCDGQKKFHSATAVVRPNSGEKEYLHEYGHVVDCVYGSFSPWNDFFLTQGDEFTHVFNQEVKRHGRVKVNGYVNNPIETFAYGFQNYYGSVSSRQKLSKKYPDLYAFMAKFERDVSRGRYDILPVKKEPLKIEKIN